MLTPIEAAHHFLNDLRMARATAMEDAEDAGPLLTAFERLGYQMLKPTTPVGLGDYRTVLVALANRGGVSGALARDKFEADASSLFTSILDGRNEHMHVGVAARRLADHALRFALMLEAGLMSELTMVKHFMVTGPTVAQPWQTVAHVRQTMLRHQFSFLPFFHLQQWHLISDHAVASYVRRTKNAMAALARTVEEVIPVDLKLIPATQISPTADVETFLKDGVATPRLVVDSRTNELRGILTAFDLL